MSVTWALHGWYRSVTRVLHGVMCYGGVYRKCTSACSDYDGISILDSGFVDQMMSIFGVHS
jgi:hypothetical protein